MIREIPEAKNPTEAVEVMQSFGTALMRQCVDIRALRKLRIEQKQLKFSKYRQAIPIIDEFSNIFNENEINPPKLVRNQEFELGVSSSIHIDDSPRIWGATLLAPSTHESDFIQYDENEDAVARSSYYPGDILLLRQYGPRGNPRAVSHSYSIKSLCCDKNYPVRYLTTADFRY